MAEINMEELKPNSHRYKAEQKRAVSDQNRQPKKPVIRSDSVVNTKKSFGKKLKSAFFSQDLNDMKSWLFWDMIVPGCKDLILDIIDNMLGGEDRSRRSGGRTDYANRYRYNSSSKKRKSNSHRRNEDDDDDVDYTNIILRNRRDAEDVVYEMHKRIRDNGTVSIAEFLDMIGLAGSFTDNDWGWDRERDINYRKVSSGWLIDVREAIYISD